jgi:hypothetical protein
MLSNLNLCICSLQVDLEVGSHCWYTPVGSANGKGRRRVEIKGKKNTSTGDVRYTFHQQSKGKKVIRSVTRDELKLIQNETADAEVVKEQNKLADVVLFEPKGES